MRFRNQDWLDLFAAINTLHSDIGPETLGERAIGAVKNLIPSEMMAFDCFKADDFSVAWITPEDAISAEDVEIFLAFAHEHPLIEAAVVEKRPDAVRVTDLIPKQQFNSTGLFNEFYRRIRITDTMAVSLPISDELTMTNSLYRSGRNFSKRDCLVLTLLSGHLRSAIMNAQKLESIQNAETRLQEALERKACGLCNLDKEGKVVYESTLARKLVEEYFPNERSTANSLPDSLVRWLSNELLKFDHDGLRSHQPLRLHKDGKSLEIRLMRSTSTKETTLLLEENIVSSPELLLQLGLTRREAEILFWMAKGKTDKDVSAILDISHRTAHKHAENIYLKLGVETRTAAMLRALEIL